MALAGFSGEGRAAAPLPARAGTDLLRPFNRMPAITVGTTRHGVIRRRRAAAEPEQPQTPANVTLRAAMVAGGATVTEGVSWRVFEVGDEPEDKRLIWSGGGAEPKIHLDPGRYRVEADYGLAQATSVIKVLEEEPLDTTLVLNVGTIRAHGAAVAGGPPLSDMFFILRRAVPPPSETEKPDPAAAELARSTLAETVFRVPAGAYRLFAQHGFASVEIPVNVEAGKDTNAEAIMNTGVLALSAHAMHDGPSLSGATFYIYEDSDAANRREIARSVRDEPKFDLPAGTYRVSASLGLAHEERKVSVAAGQEKAEAFTLNAGGVRLSSVLAGNRQPLDRWLLYKVFALTPANGSASQSLLTTASASPTIFLKRGRYRIESQYGWHNARQVREVDVSAGKTAEVSFEHTACGVTLKLMPAPGGTPLMNVKWTLKYTGGGTVLISQDAMPTLTLQTGNYQAVAQHDGKTFSRTFEAVANSEQTIELIAE